ncbi:MAG TPA: methylenetetrahydrofolate reductase [NAD(P)H] [Elusimicrobiota bacterium]|nr:methylenetetrahydrofolate reductase [NAD(P)H] [Elusimicrobiota bacterium]
MRIPELLAGGRPVFSFEFFLPKSETGFANFLGNVEEFKKLGPSFVSLTYGAGGSQRNRTVETAGKIQNQIGLETACHLSCIAHTRAEIDALLEEIAGNGITHLVALRGDHPEDGAALSAEKQDFRYARDLVERVRTRGGFSVAVAGYPETHPDAASPEEDLAHLAEKVKAGADWVITQLFFDNRRYFDFVARAHAMGIGVPIVPGIMPVASLAQLEKFTALCGVGIPEELKREVFSRSKSPEEVLRYGIEHATRQCRELLDKGAPGIHFYTLNRGHATAEILGRIRKF